MKWIRTKEQYMEYCRQARVRDDWHEPDEQGFVDDCVDLQGTHLDNAHTTSLDEYHIVLCQDGEEEVRINLAMLLAWAYDYPN